MQWLLFFLFISFFAEASSFQRWTDDLGETVWGFESICPASSTEEELAWIKLAIPHYQNLLKTNETKLSGLLNDQVAVNRLQENMLLLGKVLKELDETKIPFDGRCPLYQKHCQESFDHQVQKRKVLQSIKTQILKQSPLLANSSFDSLINTVLRYDFPYKKQDPRFLDALKIAISRTQKIIKERYKHSLEAQQPEQDILLIEELLLAVQGKETPEMIKLRKASCHLENRYLKNKAMSELRSLSFDSALIIATMGASSYLMAGKNLSLMARLAPLIAVETIGVVYNTQLVAQTIQRCEIIASHLNNGQALQECEQVLSDQILMSSMALVTSGLSASYGVIAARMKIQLDLLEKRAVLEKFKLAPAFLKQKGLDHFIQDLEKLEQNLNPKKVSAIFEAHMVGIHEVGAYTTQEILEKTRILKKAGFHKKERELILRAGIAGDEARFVYTDSLLLKKGTSPFQDLAHNAITYDLEFGEIVSISRFSENDNRNTIFKVLIRAKDPYSGEIRFREAIFKPRFWGDADGWARTPMESVAYELNRMLDMDVIPPTVYRTNLKLIVNGTYLSEGAFLYKVPGFDPLGKLPQRAFGLSHEAIISDNRVLSVLLQNVDAHASNLGLGRHWVDGKTRPVFLDWSASLRKEADVFMDRYTAFGNDLPVTKIRTSTYESLQGLDESSLWPLVKARYITENEMRGILKRRDEIIKYFDDLSLKQPIFLEE